MIAAVPDRSGSMDNELGGQFESWRDAGFAGFAAVELSAGFQKFPSGGQVERVLNLADGVLLLVDAAVRFFLRYL